MNADNIRQIRSKAKLIGDIAADIKLEAKDFDTEIKEEVLDQVEELEVVKMTFLKIIAQYEEKQKLKR